MFGNRRISADSNMTSSSATAPAFLAKSSQEVMTSSSRSATRTHPFRRTYVACISCRTRKVKCIISDRPPCAKCSREHRECVFDQQKTKKKQRAPPIWSTDATSEQTQIEGVSRQVRSSDTRGATGHDDTPVTRNLGPDTTAQNTIQDTRITQDVPDEHQTIFTAPPEASPCIGKQQVTTSASQKASAETQRRRRHSTILSDQVVRTVVSKPTDALNLLFDAAQAVTESNDDVQRHTEAIRSELTGAHRRSSAGTTNAVRSRYTNPAMNNLNEFAVLTTPDTVLPITPAVSNLSFPSDDVLDVWGRCRFVIQGWFTAQEAVTLIDL